MNRKIILKIFIGISLVISGLYLTDFGQNGDLYAGLKCPDEYQTSEEYLASTDKFTNVFFDNNPNASLGDWARERRRFYDLKGCSEAIKRYESYGSRLH